MPNHTRPDIRWLVAQYGCRGNETYISVPAGSRGILEQMGNEIAGTEALVAIYVPVRTPAHWGLARQRGRVVAAFRLLPMPSGKSVVDYPDGDLTEGKQWNIGWPCQVVYAPLEAGPYLRALVGSVPGGETFRHYTSRLRQGSVRLNPAMQAVFNDAFARFPRIGP
jgi:hypothetical protein